MLCEVTMIRRWGGTIVVSGEVAMDGVGRMNAAGGRVPRVVAVFALSWGCLRLNERHSSGAFRYAAQARLWEAGYAARVAPGRPGTH
jgi:hypothetical protein